MTMVYQDYWALAQWVRHYSRQIGIENLYIVVHGPDPVIEEIAVGANIWTVPRDSVERFDRRRMKMLNSFQRGLVEFYDWVIRTDADELICVDPLRHGTLLNLLQSHGEDSLFAMGLNLFESVDDVDELGDAPVFSKRASTVITGNYSKAWVVSSDAALMRHGVRIKDPDGTKYTYGFPEGVYLVHLKFANIAALEVVNQTRKDIARSELPGVPGLGWRKADKQARNFFERAGYLDELPWDTAVEFARAEILADMKYSDGDGVMRAPGIPYICRTTLPAWFKDI